MEQYYGLVNENDLAVVVNNEVIRADEEDGNTAAAPGKMYDGVPYVEYSVVRDQINKTTDLQEKELLQQQFEAMHRAADETET